MRKKRGGEGRREFQEYLQQEKKRRKKAGMFRNFFLSIQKHSFSNIFNIFKFHRVILPETVISSRDLMDYLWERVRIFNFILTMALTSKFTRIRWNYYRTRWDSLRKKGESVQQGGRGSLTGTLLIGKIDVRGRMAIGGLPMGDF